MSDRREEGPLGSRREQSANQQIEASLRRRRRQVLETLLQVPAFTEWLGGHVEPLLLGAVGTTNGGELQHFMGERALALRQLRDFAEFAPGFVERVLTARRVVLEEANSAFKAPKGEE